MIDQSQKSKYYELEKIQAKEVSHKIGQLKPRDRNIELKAIVLQLLESYETKNREKLLQYLIADETGSIIANFFGESGYLNSLI